MPKILTQKNLGKNVKKEGGLQGMEGGRGPEEGRDEWSGWGVLKGIGSELSRLGNL